MYRHLQEYLSKDIYPFHMPGHKRNPMFFPQGLIEMDITEIPGMDVLRAPTGILRDMQNKIAEFYGARESYILVNGSTAGIIAAVCAVSKEDTKFYAARNAHVSVYSGMALSGARPVYIQPEITGNGLAGGINPESLNGIDKGAAVIIVSPTYEGYVSDIKTIADKVHDRGGILIVDEAHGAHFKFHSSFPDSALDLGADIVVQSFHKTLPVLGQMAVLHVKSTRVDKSRLEFFLHSIQTTSPSYMLMAQLDYILDMLWKRPEIFDMYVSRLNALRAALTSSYPEPIWLTGQEQSGRAGIFDTDQGKLLFCVNTAESAVHISEVLATENRLQMEMAAGQHILAMTSVADTDEGMQRLWSAIGALNIRLELSQNIRKPAIPEIPEQALTPRQATRKPIETIPWETAADRISAELIAAYPPGIAIVAPGECIPINLPKQKQNIKVIV